MVAPLCPPTRSACIRRRRRRILIEGSSETRECGGSSHRREQLMGVVRCAEEDETAVEELRRMILGELEDDDGGFEGGGGRMWKGERRRGIPGKRMEAGAAERVERRMPVCVTSGVSYIGWAIADRLMRRGYTVRLVVETGDDLAMLGETGAFEGTEASRIFPVVVNMMEMSSLCEAFDGCAGVFHTSAFLDTAGISGYTKHMAVKEASVAGKVVEACVLTSSVRTCVFTSSLLACIWRQYPGLTRRPVSTLVDESCWSDENLCTDKKLWLALGKTMAEKAVWRAARGKDLKLATLCPALITGPGFCARNPTSTIAYLKGGREMYAEGLLATTDVSRVAEAHVRVYEAMGGSAAGRYICFDHIVRSDRDAAELCRGAGLGEHLSIIEGGSDVAPHFQLSNDKLRRLLSSRHCFVSDLIR